ncbi:hypothetical protein PLESTB_000393000 [Pleodorina starrii]|uniref:Ubiquitin-like domain-containing protein n=1 Tax=Pleodorina starrii TaxID=330485 RepID=A0A9W6BFD0_9CHLO|nr:hypothetical protein PLESTB_000393000 [Pleodorina starrii]GLC73206.1 hypothetical protein PLESTF_001346900 [Pleodorina starrii]
MHLSNDSSDEGDGWHVLPHDQLHPQATLGPLPCLLVQFHLMVDGKLRVEEEPVAVLGFAPYDMRRGSYSVLLPMEAVNAATLHVAIPPEHRRYILWSDAVASDITEALEEGRSLLQFDGHPSNAIKLVILDQRRPAPHVRVLLEQADGTPAGTERQVPLGYLWSSHDLCENCRQWGAAAGCEGPAPPLAIVVDGRRSYLPLLLDSRITEGPGPVVLRARPAAVMPVFIKSMNGMVTALDVHPQYTVHELKLLYAAHSGLPPHLLQLICPGRLLLDDRELQQYSIRPQDTIMTLLRLRGGQEVT